MNRKILFACVIGSIILWSCHQEQQDENLVLHKDLNSEFVSLKQNMIVVAPSNDKTGVTDANNIELALQTAKDVGGTVLLSDGNMESVDIYYTSRNIVVEGFNGSLKGEQQDNSIIKAGRESKEKGFQPAYSPVWTKFFGLLSPAVFQFDNPIGRISISDLTIKVENKRPTDILTDFYGDDKTYIWTMIEIIGGEYDTELENLTLLGAKSSDSGSFSATNLASGTNVGWGIHVMPWNIDNWEPGSPDPPKPNQADLFVNNVTGMNLGKELLTFMHFDNGDIEIRNLNGRGVAAGIYAHSISNSRINVTESKLTFKDNGFYGFFFQNISGGLTVHRNYFSGEVVPRNYGILFVGVSDSYVTDNVFKNFTNGFACIIMGFMSKNNTIESNDLSKSGISGWTVSNPAGPGGYLLGSVTENNSILDINFPIEKQLTLCDIVGDWSDNPSTPEYDGNNYIENWEGCFDLNKTEKKKNWELESRLMIKGPHKNKFLNK